LCRRVRETIARNNLQRGLPIIRYETTRGHEYYVGIAMDLEAFESSDEARSVTADLVACCLPSLSNAYVIDDFEQLKGLLSGAVGCEGYVASLHFEGADTGARRAQELADAIANADFSDGPDSLRTPPEAYNRLLYWCTSTGGGDLAKFVLAGELLGAVRQSASPWPLIRRLALLGHVEFARTSSGWRWSAAPEVHLSPLVGAPAFAAGRRLPSCSEAAELEIRPQPGGPDRLTCRAWTGAYSAQRWADELPQLDDWLESVLPWDERDFHGYQIELIDIDGTVTHVATPMPNEPVMHRFTRDGRTVHGWFDKDRGRWVAGDPLTVSFLIRTSAGAAAAVSVPEDNKLVVPRTDRWPLPYERSLVLASGLLPREVTDATTGQPLLVYQGIPQDFAQILAEKLNVNLDSN
jgi:hypothetical protein